MAKQKIIAGHLDHKHGYYYMVLSLPNPEKGNRKLPKWFPTGIPYDGKRQTERDAKRMLKEWREDFTSGKLTLAMIEAKKRSKGTDGAMSLKSIPIRKDMYFTDYLLSKQMWKRIHLQGIGEPFTIHCSPILANTMQRWRNFRR